MAISNLVVCYSYEYVGGLMKFLGKLALMENVNKNMLTSCSCLSNRQILDIINEATQYDKICSCYHFRLLRSMMKVASVMNKKR